MVKIFCLKQEKVSIVMTITFIYYDLPLFPFIFKPKQIVVFLLGLSSLFSIFCDNHFYLKNIPSFFPSECLSCLVLSFLLSIYSPIKCLESLTLSIILYVVASVIPPGTTIMLMAILIKVSLGCGHSITLSHSMGNHSLGLIRCI